MGRGRRINYQTVVAHVPYAKAAGLITKRFLLMLSEAAAAGLIIKLLLIMSRGAKAAE